MSGWAIARQAPRKQLFREDEAMSLIREVFGASPFGPLLEHTKKVHECVR
ncbi:unnamed protein product, partial [marine sediment metagenome]